MNFALILLLLIAVIFAAIFITILLVVILKKKTNAPGQEGEFSTSDEKIVLSTDPLKKLYDGQMSIENTAKMLKLPANNDEAAKILDMIKNHKVTAEEGKELLEAVSIKQVQDVSNPGRKRVRTLGIVTLVIGALLFLLSALMVPLTLFTSEKIITRTQFQHHSEMQQQRQDGLKKLETPCTPETWTETNLKNRPAKIGLLFSAGVFTNIISILIMIYAAGLISIKNWGRKMGIFVSVFITAVSLLVIVPCVPYLMAGTYDPSTNWGRFILVAVYVLTLILSIISFFILKSSKTIEAIQKEKELRNFPRNIRTGKSNNKFFRSRTDRKILGICGGLAEYFNIDPVLTRVGTVLLAVITAAFPVLLVYLICGIIIPLEPEKE